MRKQSGKAPASSATREPLSYLLGTRAKVGCLRVLSLTAEPLSQREVARRAAVQHRSVQLALDELVALGLVRRIQGGRDFLVALSTEYYLGAAVRDLFRSESEFFLALRRQLTAMATEAPPRGRISSMALFGSMARGEDRPGSDLDLLLITADTAAQEAALARVGALSGETRKVYGYAVRPIAYTTVEARRRWRRREPPFPEIVRDHIVLVGPPLRELLDG